MTHSSVYDLTEFGASLLLLLMKLAPKLRLAENEKGGAEGVLKYWVGQSKQAGPRQPVACDILCPSLLQLETSSQPGSHSQ